MKRRTFIKTTGALGLSDAMPWAEVLAKDPSAAFLARKTSDRMLFPRPHDGAEVRISPVGLAWLPCPSAAEYRVEISDAGGRRVYGKNAGKDPVHCPDRVFPAGRYAWDVVALDSNGGEMARHGRRRFTILNHAAELPWLDPREILRRVPEDHPRILFPKSCLGEVRSTLSTTRAKSWRACKAAADRALSKGVPDFPTYHRIEDPGTRRLEYQKYFGYFRGYVDSALMNLALAYLMTEKAKYAEAAKRILLEIATWPTADDDVTSVSAKWGDEAGLSFSKCAHVAYDWLYHAFDERERNLVSKMCRARAWQTYRRLARKNYLTMPGESHDGR
ncbi:MAG: DUF4962 domain-containing protein, partial [Planctomycetota bacterium]